MSGTSNIEDLLPEDPARITREIPRRAAALLGAEAALFLLDADGSCLHLVATSTDAYEDGGIFDLEDETSPLARAVLHEKTVSEIREEWPTALPFTGQHMAVAPVLYLNTPVGALAIGSERRLEQEELCELEKLGMSAGAAIRLVERFVDMVAAKRWRKRPTLPAEMQLEMLPPSRLRLPEADIACGIEPAYDVGGDWYDYALRSPNNLLLAIGDPTGQGLAAQVLATTAFGALRNARRSGDDLPRILTFIHDALLKIASPEQFVTMLLMEIDLKTLEMRLVNAGHPIPILIPRDPKAPARPLEAKLVSPPAGALKSSDERSDYAVQSIRLDPGSRLILYTDGITERRDRTGQMMEVEGFLSIVEKHRNEPSHQLTRNILREVTARTDAPLADDASVLTIKLEDRAAQRDL